MSRASFSSVRPQICEESTDEEEVGESTLMDEDYPQIETDGGESYLETPDVCGLSGSIGCLDHMDLPDFPVEVNQSQSDISTFAEEILNAVEVTINRNGFASLERNSTNFLKENPNHFKVKTKRFGHQSNAILERSAIIAVHSHGKLLAFTGHEDKKQSVSRMTSQLIHLFNVSTEQELHLPLKGLSSTIESMRFSEVFQPSLLAYIDSDRNINIRKISESDDEFKVLSSSSVYEIRSEDDQWKMKNTILKWGKPNDRSSKEHYHSDDKIPLFILGAVVNSTLNIFRVDKLMQDGPNDKQNVFQLTFKNVITAFEINRLANIFAVSFDGIIQIYDFDSFNLGEAVQLRRILNLNQSEATQTVLEILFDYGNNAIAFYESEYCLRLEVWNDFLTFDSPKQTIELNNIVECGNARKYEIEINKSFSVASIWGRNSLCLLILHLFSDIHGNLTVSSIREVQMPELIKYIAMDECHTYPHHIQYYAKPSLCSFPKQLRLFIRNEVVDVQFQHLINNFRKKEIELKTVLRTPNCIPWESGDIFNDKRDTTPLFEDNPSIEKIEEIEKQFQNVSIHREE